MTVAKVAKARTHHALCFTKSATRPSTLDNQSDDEGAIGITRSVIKDTGLTKSPKMSSLEYSLRGTAKETRLVEFFNGSENKDYGTAPMPIGESIYHNHHI